MKTDKATAKTKTSTKSTKSKNQMKGKDTATETGLRKLFEAQLKDIYWAEKAMVKAIPKMIDKAHSQELVDALDSHLIETQEQVTRCEQVFESIGKKPQTEVCDAMKGLIEEATELMEEFEEGPTRDAAIICAAQRIEHYEIATYGTLATFADILGEAEAASLLEQTLEEEKNADELLSEVSMSSVSLESNEEE